MKQYLTVHLLYKARGNSGADQLTVAVFLFDETLMDDGPLRGTGKIHYLKCVNM